MSAADKIPTSGGEGLGQNPFGALSGAGLPVAPQSMIQSAAKKEAPARNRGRVDIKRTTAGRGPVIYRLDVHTASGLRTFHTTPAPAEENLMARSWDTIKLMFR